VPKGMPYSIPRGIDLGDSYYKSRKQSPTADASQKPTKAKDVWTREDAKRIKETQRRASAEAYEILKAPPGGTKGPVDRSLDTDSRPMQFGRDKLTPRKRG
jgi:hypothetical protein